MEKTLLKETQELLLERLYDLEDYTDSLSSYIIDWSYELLETYNMTGSVYCNSYKSREMIFNNYNEFERVLEFLNDMGYDEQSTEFNLFSLSWETIHVHVVLVLGQYLINLFIEDENLDLEELEDKKEVYNKLVNYLESLDVYCYE